MAFDPSSATGAAVSTGAAAAQGGLNPIADISAIVSLTGLGMSLFGSDKAVGVAKQEAGVSSEIAGLEGQVNAQRQQQMVLQSNRQQLQTIRQSQIARSMALTSATNQGAQFGTGLQGGLGQIQGDTDTNLLNNNQNLQIGQNIFGIDSQISQKRMQLAALGGNMASAQGYSALGGGIMKGAGAIGQLSGQFTGMFGGGAKTQSSGGYGVTGQNNSGSYIG